MRFFFRAGGQTFLKTAVVGLFFSSQETLNMQNEFPGHHLRQFIVNDIIAT